MTPTSILLYERGGAAVAVECAALQCDRAATLDAVGIDGLVLEYASARFRDDGAVVQAAAQENASALEYASKRLKRDAPFMLQLVRHDGNSLRYAGNALRNDRALALAAVRQCGTALKYASERLQRDVQVVTAAVRQSGGALKYAAAYLQKNMGLALLAKCHRRPESVLRALHAVDTACTAWTTERIVHFAETLPHMAAVVDAVHDRSDAHETLLGKVEDMHAMLLSPSTLSGSRLMWLDYDAAVA